ncbi:MAG: hypothetical protein ACRD0Z_01655 [Acidimicrobiales bacterium]
MPGEWQSIVKTSQGNLAYVKQSTPGGQGFAIASYSTSPPPSLFDLPADASCVKATSLGAC